MADYTGSSSDALDLFNQINLAWQNRGGGTAAKTTVDQYGDDFVQQFQNAVGRAPTADEINQFYTQAVNPIMNTSAGFSNTDPNAVVQQYIPQAFQSQIQQNQQNQTQQLGTQIGNLAGQVGQQTLSQLSDPNSAAYQQFAGSENNMGITPSSGAFQEGIGGAVGQATSGTIQSLLSSLGGNAIAGNQSPSLASLSGQGQQAQQNMTGYNQQLNDFQLQSQLGQMLAQMSQPSTAQKDIGMASGASQALGNLTNSGATAAGTWICTQLKKEGLLTQTQVDELHGHLYRGFWSRPFKFIGYLMFGKCLVYLANKYNTNWALWKTEFYDDVMSESDPVRAVDLYADTFWKLYANIICRQEERKYASR